MGYFRILCTMATRCCGELLGPEHDYTDAVYVTAVTAQGARSTALATWPDIRTIENVQEVYC